MKTRIRRFVFVVLWMFIFGVVAAGFCSLTLPGTLPNETSLAEVSGKMVVLAVVFLAAAFTGLIFGLVGCLPGTRRDASPD
jgi:hypothetical protein